MKQTLHKFTSEEPESFQIFTSMLNDVTDCGSSRGAREVSGQHEGSGDLRSKIQTWLWVFLSRTGTDLELQLSQSQLLILLSGDGTNSLP